MIKKTSVPILLFLVAVACSPSLSEDDQLKQAVDAALAGASDLPPSGLMVEVDNGVVMISGTIDCEDCGGLRTPGGVDNIQLSIGAVVRAVPGVGQVEFSLD